MAKNRLIKSSRGNGYGILDEETNMVTPVSFDTNQLIESKKGNGFGLQFGDSVVPVDISGLSKSDINLFKKKVDTELSGAENSTDGAHNDDAWYENLYSGTIGVAKNLIDLVPITAKGFLRSASKSAMTHSGAPSMSLIAEAVGGEKAGKQMEEISRLSEKNALKGADQLITYEKQKLAKGTSSITELVGKGYVTNGDAENIGYQLADGITQMVVGAIPGIGGMALYSKNLESRYEEAKAKGFSDDKAFNESAVGALVETVIEKNIGVDKLISKGLGKTLSKEAIKDISGALISKEAFQEVAKKYAKSFSLENLKQGFVKGFLPEAAEEFAQTYIDGAEQDLFDYYERKRKEDNPNAKLELYDAKDEEGVFNTFNPETGKAELSPSFKSKTLLGALDASFYGGLTGQMGGMFVDSQSFNPSIYSTLQNAYDSQGKEALAKSVETIKTGLTKANSNGKLDNNSYNNALKNVDKIASNVSKFEQNSDINSYSRYLLYDNTERIIPQESAKIARNLAEIMTPLELPTEDQIKNDVDNDEVSPMSFEQAKDVPEPFRNYVSVIENENGEKAIQGNIPNSIVKAYNDNQMAVQEAMNNPLFAVQSLTDNSRLVSIEDLERIGQQGGNVNQDPAQQLNFKAKFEANKKSFNKGLRVINYAKEISKNIVDGNVADAETLRRGYANIFAFNEGDTVFYGNKSAKVLEISPNGQSLKLSGLQDRVSASDENLSLEDAERETPVAPTTEAQVEPTQATEPVATQPVIEQPEEEKITGRTMRDAVDELIPFTYRGETGEIYKQRNGVVVFESPNRVYEFGNINDIGNKSIDEFDIIPQEMEIGDDFSVTIDGKKFTNKSQNPFKAITYDEEGNAVSIKLDNDKGQTRVIKGTRAMLIDAKYKIKKLFNDATRDQLAAAADDAARQAATAPETTGESGQTTTTTEGKPIEQAPSIAQQEYDRRVKEIRAKLAEQESEQATQNRQAVANLAASLYTAGINVEILDSNAIRAKYDKEASQGMFLNNKGVIVINESVLPTEWGKTIIFHEGTHPIINIIRNTEPKLYKQLVAAAKEEAKTNPEVNKILQQIRNTKAYGDEFTRNDELVAELIARVSSGKLDLNQVKPSFKQSVIDFINKIAKAIGLNPILKDSDQVALTKLATQISDVLNAGKDISEIVGSSNVSKFAVASDINTESENSAIYGGGIQQSEIERAKVTDKPVVNVYKEEGVSDLPIRSLKDIYDSYGGKVVFINSDPTKVGNLKLISGKEIFLYGGPEYMSLTKNIEGNVGFATTLESKVKTHDKLRNKVFGEGKGVTIVATQSPDSIMSNSYSLRYILDAITQLPKNITSDPAFKKEFFGEDIKALQLAFGTEAYDAFVKKFKNTDFSSTESIGVMIDELGYKLSSASTPASFKARKALTNNLVAGFVTKSSRVDTKNEKGFVSVSPKKFIAKSLYDEFGVNAESIIKQIGNKDIVDKFFNEGIWGLAVSGFETSPESNYVSIQDKGVAHPLFNAKFYGENPFKLDAAYKVDDLILPIESGESKSGKVYLDKFGNPKPYEKKTSLQLAASIYVGGDIEAQLSDIDRTYSPETTVAEAGMTMQEREDWKKKNKVSQRQVRNPLVQEAAKNLLDGNITLDGYVDVVRSNQPIKPFLQVPKLPTLKDVISALDNGKLGRGGIVGVNRSFNDGDKVATRLDIPAYEDYDTWVVSIHDQLKEGKVLAYGQTAVLKNVQFKTSAKGGIGIAIKNDKNTIARMFGEWANESPESVHKRAEQLINDPQWVQVGMNPFRHSFFYDKSTGEALLGADEVIQVGSLVLAKNVERAPFGSQAFVDNFSFKNNAGETIQFSDISRDDKRIQFVRENLKNYSKSEIVDALMGAPFNLTKEKAEDIVAQASYDPLAPSLPTDNPDLSIPEGSKLNQKSKVVDEYNEGYDKEKKGLLTKAAGFWAEKMKYIALQYDSRFFARRKLDVASTEESLAKARLRTLNGVAYAAGQELSKHYNDIFGNGLEAEGERALNSMIFNLRILQIDKNTEQKYQDEIEKLTLDFSKENRRLPSAIEARSIAMQARKNVPVKMHGKTKNGIPATSQTAQSFLDGLRAELGESEYNMLRARAELFRKVNNAQVIKLRDAGLISKEVADTYKDDFYAYRKTLERLYGEQDSSVIMLNGVTSIKGWSSLSKEGAENYLEQDARLLLAESFIGTARAIAKNKLREAIFDENIKVDENGREQSIIDKEGRKVEFIKPAKYLRDKNGDIRSNGKELSVADADEGFVNVPYKKDGIVNYFQMEKEMFNQIEGNNIKWKDKSAYYDTTDYANRILTGFATRNNPFFWIGNIPMDLQQQVFFTDIWTQGSPIKSNVYVAGARAIARTIKFANLFGRNTELVDNLLAEYIAAGGAMDRMSTMKEQRQRTIELSLYEGEKNSKGQWIKSKFKAFNSKMNEGTEIAMRLAAYDQAKNNLINKFNEDNNGANPSSSDMLKIQEIAAAQSRAYTDFAQRGTDVPNLNIAYLNSAIQASGVALEYISDNPAKFANKASQLVIGKFLGTLAIMALMGDAYDELDEYRKDLYSFMFSFDTKMKDDKGNPIFVTADIKNNPQLIPLLGVSREAAEMSMRYLRGDKQKDYTVGGTIDRTIELLNHALFGIVPNVTSIEDLKKSGAQILAKHTLANIAIKGFMGFDAFRNRDIEKAKDADVSPYMRGQDDKSIPYFYKAIAMSMANNTSENQVSPAKLQAMAETLITSPSTTPWVGLAYSLLSDVANLIVPAKSQAQKGEYSVSESGGKLLKSLTKKFATYTDAEKAEIRSNDVLYKMSREESLRFNDTERKIDTQLKDLYKADPKNFFTNVDKMAKEEGYWENDLIMSRIDARAKNIDNAEYDRAFIKSDIANEVKILFHTKGVEGKANLLKYMFEKDATKARQVIDGLIDYGMSTKEAYDTEDLYLKSIK
jgi:hypothetical protein